MVIANLKSLHNNEIEMDRVLHVEPRRPFSSPYEHLNFLWYDRDILWIPQQMQRVGIDVHNDYVFFDIEDHLPGKVEIAVHNAKFRMKGLDGANNPISSLK